MCKLYDQNKHIINSMSNRIFSIVDGKIERKEIISEANLIFCECMNTFDKHKGEFDKYLSTSLYRLLWKFAKKECFYLNQILSEPVEVIIDIKKIHEDHNPFFIFFDSLHKDTQKVIKIILKTGKKNQRELRKTVKEELSWEHRRITREFLNIKEALTC